MAINKEIQKTIDKIVLGELPCNEVMFCYEKCDDKVFYKKKWRPYTPLKSSEKEVLSSSVCPDCLQKHAKKYRRKI